MYRSSNNLCLLHVYLAGGGLVTATFATLPWIHQIFKKSITSQKTLALSSSLDKNKDIKSAQYTKFFCPTVIYLVRRSFTSKQENQTHLYKVRIHQIAASTAALMYSAHPLESSDQSCKEVTTASLTGRATSSVALKDL